METKLNILIFLGILGATAALHAETPVAALDPEAPETSRLAELEDAFARDPSHGHAAQALADAYLELEQPGLAVAVLQSADGELMREPMFAHRMAQAYEATGHVEDAHATAAFARDLCSRRLRAFGAEGCSHRSFAILDVHARVLSRLVEWGVTNPEQDPRTGTAYQLEMRVARLAPPAR